MALDRPPWSPDQSDGCSTPVLAWVIDADLREACRACRGCCLAHDLEYYTGGSRADRLRADFRLFECIARRMGDEVAWTMFDAVYRFGRSHWYTPPGVERAAQET